MWSKLPFEEIYPKTILEHQAGTGGYDALLISPAWLADVVANDAVVPLDPYIEKYGVKSEFDDINPAFKDWMSYNGKIYGLVVDGDVLVTYYRKDLFEDPENQAAFKAKYGYDLAPPKSYKEFGEIACFLTEKYQPDIYGAGVINTGYTYLLLQRALPHARRQVLRSGDDEGDRQLRGRRQGADRDGRAEQVHGARHRDLGLRGESLGAECRRDRDDHLLAAAGSLDARRQHRRQGARPGCRRPR